MCAPRPHAAAWVRRCWLAHALARARQRGLATFAAWATPFSLPVFGRAGFSPVRTLREPFQGVMFERYRIALGRSAHDA